MNRILKSLLIFLFVVVIFEISYFLFLFKNNNNSSVNQEIIKSTNNLVQNENIIPTQALSVVQINEIDKFDDWMNKFNNFVIASVIISRGSFEEIIEVNDNKHGFKIILANKNLNKYKFYYNDDNIGQINFYEQKNDKKEKIDRTTLKRGDQITIIENYKSLEDKSNTKINIEIIKSI